MARATASLHMTPCLFMLCRFRRRNPATLANRALANRALANRAQCCVRAKIESLSGARLLTLNIVPSRQRKLAVFVNCYMGMDMG